MKGRISELRIFIGGQARQSAFLTKEDSGMAVKK